MASLAQFFPSYILSQTIINDAILCYRQCHSNLYNIKCLQCCYFKSESDIRRQTKSYYNNNVKNHLIIIDYQRIGFHIMINSYSKTKLNPQNYSREQAIFDLDPLSPFRIYLLFGQRCTSFEKGHKISGRRVK